MLNNGTKKRFNNKRIPFVLKNKLIFFLTYTVIGRGMMNPEKEKSLSPQD